MSGHYEGFQNLLRVIVAEPQSGDSRVLALEVYDDGLAFRWATPRGLGSGPHINPFGLMMTSLTVRDDLGKGYEYAGGIAGTATGTLGKVGGGISFFMPAIRAEASWLEVLVNDGSSVRFELADPRGQ